MVGHESGPIKKKITLFTYLIIGNLKVEIILHVPRTDLPEYNVPRPTLLSLSCASKDIYVLFTLCFVKKTNNIRIVNPARKSLTPTSEQQEHSSVP